MQNLEPRRAAPGSKEQYRIADATYAAPSVSRAAVSLFEIPEIWIKSLDES